MDTQIARLELTLRPHAREVGRARFAVREWLVAAGFIATADDGVQIASELVANAIAETQQVDPSANVTAHLSLVGQRPMLQVWDCSTSPPIARIQDTTAERGRGVMITQALAAEFGHESFQGGKVVWALLPVCTTEWGHRQHQVPIRDL